MIAGELKQRMVIIHDEQPVLIKIGDQLVAVKELQRTTINGKVCMAFVPVDIVIETK